MLGKTSLRQAGLQAGERYTLHLAPGRYYANYIRLLQPVDALTTSIEIVGAGMRETHLIPNATSQPVFFTIEAAFMFDVRLRGIGIVGVGAANPGRDGLAVVGVSRQLDMAEGVSFGDFSRVRVHTRAQDAGSRPWPSSTNACSRPVPTKAASRWARRLKSTASGN